MGSLRFQTTALVVGITLSLPASAVSLQSLLARMEQGPEVRAAWAEQRALAAEQEERSEERGWSLFGGATAGRYDELEPTVGSVDYTGYGAQLGLRYPLLGTLRNRTRALAEARTAQQRQKFEAQLAQTEQRLRLRATYADWWESQQYRRLCRTLESRADRELSRVSQRAEQGDLRSSEQMLLEQRWDRHLESCERRAERATELRHRLESISGVAIPVDARASALPLPLAPASTEAWQPLIRQHPLMAQQRSTLKGAQRLRHDRWYHEVDANLTLAHQFDWRDDISGTGTGLVAGLSFEVPLKALAGQDSDSAPTQRLRSARHELDATQRELTRSLSDALAGYRAALAETRDQMRQVRLSRRVESERQARDGVDGSDGFMALRMARVQTAGAMHDFIRSWRNAWQQETQLRLLASLSETERRYLGREGLPWPGPDAKGDSTPVPLQTGSGSSWSRSVYVWDSDDLLDSATREQALDSLQQADFDRIHLGLSAQQIENRETLARQLKAVLKAAQSRGFEVTLLLGEPNWMKPDQRPKLRTLIQRLAGLDFDGLHLDLEVEQLGWPVPQETLEQWMATVAMAQDVSPWPVSLVSHHRWFAAQPEGTCVPCRIERMDVESVSLMLYTTQNERLIERTTAIARRWPELRFRLTQSAEADLPPGNSWYGTPGPELERLERDWRQAMKPSGVSGIEWQDWRGYQANAEEDQP